MNPAVALWLSTDAGKRQITERAIIRRPGKRVSGISPVLSARLTQLVEAIRLHQGDTLDRSGVDPVPQPESTGINDP